MSIKYGILIPVIILFVYSCSQKNQFPPKRFEKVDSENVVIIQPFLSDYRSGTIDSVQNQGFDKELDELFLYKRFYDDRDVNFSLVKLEELWNNLRIKRNNFNFEDFKQWINVTGFLLEITGSEIFASELEETLFRSSSLLSEPEYEEIEKLIIPWIYTKNVDHIQINLFASSTIKYSHTLKGDVEITQETNYPESGKVQIRFKMENKRYIELYIRIPDWAENVTVVEKGVKYVATPGSYCQIVRKWKDGDFVEIDFSLINKPQWLNSVN